LASGEAGPDSADHGLRRATHTGFKWYKVKGKIKEIAGTLSGNTGLEAEGKK
jgi:hypothetical protein